METDIPWEFKEFPLNSGRKILLQNEDGRRFLDACERGDLSVLEDFVQNGASLEKIVDSSFFAALRNGQTHIVEYLFHVGQTQG